MNLIIQGLQVDTPTLKTIAKTAAASTIDKIDSTTPYEAFALRHVNKTPELLAALDKLCAPAQLDYALIADDLQLSDFKLVTMDMDSTVITIECIDEIADMCGLKKEVSAITEAAMRGEIKDFSESLTRRVALLQGLDASALERVYNERLQLSMGAEAMLDAIQAQGSKSLLVSGGFTFFTERLQPRLNLTYTRANTLEIIDGKLTGKVLGTIVDGNEKAATVRQVCNELGIGTHEALVMGDGANDLTMMGLAGLSVAFRAKPVVRQQASVAFNYVGLDGVLNLFA